VQPLRVLYLLGGLPQIVCRVSQASFDDLGVVVGGVEGFVDLRN
jgi:hypothetical protein